MTEPREKPERPEKPEYTVYGKGGSSGVRREAPRRAGKGDEGTRSPPTGSTAPGRASSIASASRG